MTLSKKAKEAIKTALRMFGTLVSIVATLMLITLFSQEHWAFMLFLSIFTVFLRLYDEWQQAPVLLAGLQLCVRDYLYGRWCEERFA